MRDFEIKGKEAAQASLNAYLAKVCCDRCGRAYQKHELWDDWKRVASVRESDVAEHTLIKAMRRGLKFVVSFSCTCPACQ